MTPALPVVIKLSTLPLQAYTPLPDKPGDEGWEFLTSYEYRYYVLLTLGLPVLQQASGATTVLLYSSQARAGGL